MRFKPILLSIIFILLFAGLADAAWVSKRLTYDGGTAPVITKDSSGNIHTVWVKNGIHYKKFNGVYWGPEQVLTGDTPIIGSPDIVVHPTTGRVHVIWGWYDTWSYRVSCRQFNGISWEAEEILSDPGDLVPNAVYPALTVDSSGKTHAVWFKSMTGFRWAILQKVYNAGAWSSTSTITSEVWWDIDGTDNRLDIAAGPSGNTLHLFWDDIRNTKAGGGTTREVYYKYYNGASWGTDERLTTTTTRENNFYPKGAVDTSGNAYVVWQGVRSGLSRVYYKKRTGAAWDSGNGTLLTTSTSTSGAPSITAGSGTVMHAAWGDYRDTNWEIYYRQTIGGVFAGSEVRISNNSGISQAPSITTNSSGLPRISWHDNSAGPNDIYYAADTAGISGTVTLNGNPSPIEISAYQNGILKGLAVIPTSGAYVITDLAAGTYSVEATAPGYEIKPYGNVAVVSGFVTSGINFTLNRAWPMFHQDRGHTGNSPDTALSPPLCLKWSFLTGSLVYSSPAIANGVVYITSADNKLYAIKDDGTFQWSYSTGAYINSSPAIANGVVYIGSNDNKLYAIRDDGTFKWSFSASAGFVSSPAVVNGVVYVGAQDNKLYAIRDDGTLKWSFLTGAFINSSPAIANGVVYVGSTDNKLYAIKDDGTFKWSYATGGAITCSPSVANGVVYIGSNDNILYAIKDGGTFMWSFSTGGDIHSSPAIANGVVYIGSADNKLYAIKDDGTFKWSYATGGAITCSPSVANGVVYIGSNDNILYAIKDDGTFQWSYSTGGDIQSSPAIVNGVVYVGSYDKKLYALETPGSISGSITLDPPRSVSVEVVASQNGVPKGSAVITGSGAYTISGLASGVYSVEAHSAGYDVKPYLTGVLVTSGATSTGINLALNQAWPMYQQDMKHTGASPASGTLLGFSPKWSYNAGGDVVSSPVVDDGVVYVCARSDEVLAINPNGSLKWSSFVYNASGYMNFFGKGFAPAVYDGRVYAPLSGGMPLITIWPILYGALDINTGSRVAGEFASALGITDRTTSPIIANNRAYVVADIQLTGTYLYSINAYSTGEGVRLTWRYPLPANSAYSSPAYNDGALYFGAGDGRVYSIYERGTTFEVKWTSNLGSAIKSSPAVSNGVVFVGSDSGNLYALDDNNSGNILWSYGTGAAIKSCPAVTSGKLFVASGGKVTALTSAGSLLWQTPGLNITFESSPIVMGNNVFVCSASGELYGIDASTGAIIASVKVTSEALVGAPAIDGSTIYVSSLSNRVYAYNLLIAETTPEGFQVSNLRISREADSVWSAVRLTWDPTGEVDVWATTEGYTSYEGWVNIGSTTESYWRDPNQVGTGEAEKYYKVVLNNVPQGAIYSAEAVGKVNITCSPGYNLISMPLMPYSMSIADVIGNQLSGGIQADADAVYDKMGITSVYNKAYLSSGGIWTDAQTGGASTMEVDPEKGYFIYRKGPGPKTITLVGEVLDAPFTSTVEAGYSLIGTMFPKNITLEASGLELVANSGIQALADAVYSKQGITSIYDKTYFNSQWLNAANNNPVSWGLSRGKGYFYQRRNTQMEWVRTKPW